MFPWVALDHKAIARYKILSALKNKPEVSILIVGGGTNGIGTFGVLALKGVEVLLVISRSKVHLVRPGGTARSRVMRRMVKLGFV